MSTLNGYNLTDVRAQIPAWGRWFVDATVDKEVELTGAATVKIADLTLIGTILSGGKANGRSYYRVVAGANGWGKTLPDLAYANDATVKASTVLADAARACGEKIADVPDDRVGPAWARPEGPASQVLEQIYASRWYVDEAGVTRIGKRAAKAATVKIDIVSQVDKARGVLTLAAESIATLLPGVIVSGMEAVDVWHEASAKGGLRTTIWGKTAAQTSRRLAALRAIVEQLDPDRKFRGVWEYRVIALEGNRLTLQPVRVSSGMPDLRRVKVSPGVAGAKSTLIPGAVVYVGFVDASPARPMVLGMEDPDGEGFLPLLTKIDAETFVQLGAGLRPAIGAGDLAGGIFPVAPTQTKVTI